MNHPIVDNMIATGFPDGQEPRYLTGSVTHRVELRISQRHDLPSILVKHLRSMHQVFDLLDETIVPLEVVTEIGPEHECTTGGQALDAALAIVREKMAAIEQACDLIEVEVMGGSVEVDDDAID